MQSRSLFQVFVDNLTLPSQIQGIKDELDLLRGPTSVKESFQQIVKKCERVFKCGSEQILEECGVATPGRKRQKTSAGSKQSAQPEESSTTENRIDKA